MKLLTRQDQESIDACVLGQVFFIDDALEVARHSGPWAAASAVRLRRLRKDRVSIFYTPDAISLLETTL